MDTTPTLLVATHLSSLPSPSPVHVAAHPTRQNEHYTPQSQLNDIPDGHAVYASVLHSDTIGTILLRVTGGSRIVELASISANVPPIRLSLPAPAVPSPSLFFWEDREIHVLVLTETGTLYRLIVPIQHGTLWGESAVNAWIRDYQVKALSPDVLERPGAISMHGHGTDSVVVGLPNGVVLRLDVETGAYDGREEEWTEAIFQHSSFLTSLTSLLHTATPGAADIVSIASHPWPTDIGNVWTLSRDRTLRLWKPRLGCVASRTLPLTSAKHEHPSHISPKATLLDEEHQNLLKIFSVPSAIPGESDVYALAFVPTPSTTSGGFFTLLDTTSDHLVELGIISCPRHTTRCHLQDFYVKDQTLYALWERQGQSMVESLELSIASFLNLEPHPTNWRTSKYAEEPELSPSYMEEHLLSPGALTDKFLEVTMKPGVFSSLTLRTAIDRYTEAYNSIPGTFTPPSPSKFNTLAEHIASVVGSAVVLNRDPLTGGFQHPSFWAGLKRDWEGFLARCRDIERSARWPLALGNYGSKGVLFVERERVGSLYQEDAFLTLRRMLEEDIPMHDDHVVIGILWSLRTKLGPALVHELENRILTNILKDELSFSLIEILQEQARETNFENSSEAGAASWFDGRLRSVENLDAVIRSLNDTVGALDLAVKPEEEDGAKALSGHITPPWIRCQAAAYAAVSIQARYDISLTFVILLLCLANDLPSWGDAAVPEELLAVFRGLATLRYVANQPVEGSPQQRSSSSSTDEVIDQLRGMNVSNASSRQPSVKSSLLQILMDQSPVTDDIAVTAHNYLDSTGILRSINQSNVTRYEASFCNQILSLGFVNVVDELLSWLPRTRAVVFLRARVYLKRGRPDDAADLLERLSGAFGGNYLTQEDSSALAAVLSNTVPIESQYAFYVYAAELFRPLHTYQDVKFNRLALQVAPPGTDTSQLWKIIVKGLMNLGLYREAYATAMTTPFDVLRREFATQLAIRMCEDNAVESAMSLDFTSVANEVEAVLAFKARNADPRSKPCYAKILYTWYTRRGDYRNASMTMFLRARKLHDLITDANTFALLAEDQLDSISIAINSLHLVDAKLAWVLLPSVSDTAKRRSKFSKYIPESKYLLGKHDAEVVSLADMQSEYTLLKAQIDMIKREPSLLRDQDFLLSAPVIVMRLAATNQYPQAFGIASSLKVDMTDIFIHLTNQCVRLSRSPGAILQEETSSWLLTDNAASWGGTPSDRGWRYLQQSLKRYDGAETDYRYTKASLETILTVERSVSPPVWLTEILQKAQPEYLIRLSLRYENIQDAINYAYALVLHSDKLLSQDPSQNASTTWLPYTLIDQVLVTADNLPTSFEHLADLKTAVMNRIKRMEKMSRVSA